MTRGRLLTGIVLAVLAGIGVWIARNTYWDQTDEFTPPRGAAAEDPYYSLERFAQGLGVKTRQVPTLEKLPPANGVLIYGFATQNFQFFILCQCSLLTSYYFTSVR